MLVRAYGLAAGELLPALDDDVAIQGVEFHQEGVAFVLLGGDQGRAAAAKQVEDVFPRPGGILQGPRGQLDRLFGEVDHALRVNLLDGPDVNRIVRPEELVAGAFFPAVKTPFVIAHEVLAGQDGVLLDPDDGLGEVQLAGLKHRRIIAAVRIASPQIEGFSWQQYPGQVPEPGVQEFFKVGFGKEVVDEGAVLGAQLFVSGVALARMAADVQPLMMGGGKGTEAGGDGVVAAGLDFDVVRRIAVDQMDRGASQKLVDIRGLRRIAAQEAMVPQQPEVAGFGAWRYRAQRRMLIGNR